MLEPFNATDLDKVLIVLFVLLLRIGFALIHIGCIPTTDVNYIYIQHLLNASVTTVVFWIVGHGFSTGEDYAGLVGWDGCWFKWNHDHGLRMWSAIMYASALSQMVSAGRAHLFGDFFIATVISGLLHPIILHWVWTPKGWMEWEILEGPFIDHAGSCVCHMFGGAIALAAMLILGRRIISVSELDYSSLAVNSQATTLIGYALIITGTIVTTVHPPYWQTENFQENMIKCAISFSVGMMVVICLACFACQKFNYWVMIWAIQGGLASIVSLTGGIEGISPMLTVLYASISSGSYLIFSTLVRATGFEDYCNILSTHLVPGALATYFAAFGYDKYFDQQNIRYNKHINNVPSILLWQGICSVIIFSIGFITSMTLYSLLKAIGILRNKPEREIHRDLLAMGHGRPTTRCCPFFRQFNHSTANLIRPGFHTILHFKNRRRSAPVHTIKVDTLSPNAQSSHRSHPLVKEEIASTSSAYME